MIILVVGILLIIYCLTNKKFSIWVGMLFIILILGFQEGIPGDYVQYKYFFEYGDPGKYFGGQAKDGEFVYIWLTMKLHNIMSFHMFVLITSLIQCVAMALMIKTYSEKQYQFFGVLLIFFTQNIMLLQMKAMQQGYAIDLLFLGFYLLGKRRFFSSLIPVVLAYGCHNSAMIVFPFFIVLWCIMILRHKRNSHVIESSVKQVNEKNSRFALYTVLSLWVFYILKFTIFDSYINPFLNDLEFFEYNAYLEEMKSDNKVALWILLYYSVCVYTVALYYGSEQNWFKRYLAFLSIVCIFLTIGTFGYSNLMRVNMYFLIFSVVVYPNVAALLRNNYGNKVALSFVVGNILFVMLFSVRSMLSTDFTNGTGYAPFVFSFFNW